ncbi:MAG TPA: putative colanic acid biosynthesis acetyltransferase [Cytophagaceae bacterium]|jgi:putative colanic acid biosynthesis acetyltransferase WcaF|nr:putative colanic acid biosynthesis acetyltransferase [Cytophagaceae bacterium]
MQDLSSFKMDKNFRGRPALVVQLWWLIDSLFFRTSPQVFYGWRNMLLRLFGAKIGKHVIIRPTARITYPWKLEIGDYSWIGDDVVLYSLGRINIGKNSVVSQKSYLCAGNHDYTKSSFDIFSSPITVEDEVWIATDVFVGPGVTIGKGAVVGARSSVFKSVEGGNVYAGNPLKMVKKRTEC